MSENDDAFWKAYSWLADEGSVDSSGGAESIRVLKEWNEAGRPKAVFAFILRRANAMPESLESLIVDDSINES